MDLNLLWTILAVLAVIYIVPFLVYGVFSTVWGLKPPEGASPGRFLVSVLVQKVGVAAAFVLLFSFAREIWVVDWLTYAVIWWVMLAVGEIGQAVGPNYSLKEAIAGIISETVYFPLAAYVTVLLLG